MSSFVWDPLKELANIAKHGVGFATACEAFFDPQRKIYIDSKHSKNEERYFCVGQVGGKVLTVRFVYREQNIRIVGAGYWRKGKECYEKEEKR